MAVASASNALLGLACEFSLFLALPSVLPRSWAVYPVQHPKVGCVLYQIVLLCNFFRLMLSPRQGTHISQMPRKFITFWEQKGREETRCTRPGQGSSQPTCKVVYFFLNFPSAATCFFFSSNLSFLGKTASFCSLYRV